MLRLKKALLSTVASRGVMLLLLVSVLWKGGHTLPVTACLVLVAWLCSFARSGNDVGRKQSADVPLLLHVAVLGFIAWTFLSFVFSSTQNLGLDETVQTAALGMLCLWAARESGRSPGLQRSIPEAMLITAIAACGIGMLVYVLQPVNRFTGTFLDPLYSSAYWPDGWADYLLLMWALPFIVLPAVPRWRMAAHALAGGIIGTLLLSYSRGAFIVLCAQTVLLFYLRLRSEGSLSKRGLMRLCRDVLLTLVVAVAVFGVANAARSRFFPVQSMQQRVMFAVPGEGMASVTERTLFWNQAWMLSLQRPLLGWGPFSFRDARTPLQTTAYVTTDQPHSLFLKLAAERGWPSVVLFLVIMCVVFRGAWRTGKRVGGEAYERTVILSVGLLGVLLHHLIDYDFFFLGIAVPFWLLAGMLAGHARPGRWSVSLHVAERVIMSIVLLLVLWQAPRVISSGEAEKAERRSDVNAALSWYAGARNGLFTRDSLLRESVLLLREGRLAEADDSLNRFFSRNMQDPRIWTYKGDLATARGDSVRALQMYEEAFQRGRFSYLILLRILLDAHATAGKTDILAGRQAEFDAILESFASAFRRDIHYVSLTGNADEFPRAAAAMARLYPEDASRYFSLAAQVMRDVREIRAQHARRPEGLLW